MRGARRRLKILTELKSEVFLVDEINFLQFEKLGRIRALYKFYRQFAWNILTLSGIIRL